MLLPTNRSRMEVPSESSRTKKAPPAFARAKTLRETVICQLLTLCCFNAFYFYRKYEIFCQKVQKCEKGLTN